MMIFLLVIVPTVHINTGHQAQRDVSLEGLDQLNIIRLYATGVSAE